MNDPIQSKTYKFDQEWIKNNMSEDSDDLTGTLNLNYNTNFFIYKFQGFTSEFNHVEFS